VQTLQDHRKAITDGIETANMELQLLGSLAAGGKDAAMKPSISGNELANVLKTLSESADRARVRIRTSTIDLRELDRQIERKQFELQQIATERKSETKLIANIRVERALNAPVSVTYPVRDAGWEWLYEVRLDTVAKQLTYFRQVAVHQASGDAWSNVKLTVTTANDQDNTEAPKLPSLFVNGVSRRPASRLYAAKGAADATGEIQEVIVTGSYLPATTIASQYLVNYQIPGRVTVLANRQTKVLPIDEKSFGVRLVIRTVPESEASAYLEARFTYSEELPLQRGMAQLYRDGMFIGEAPAPAFLPGKEVRVPFGVDERVQVVVHHEPEASRQDGSFYRSPVDQTRSRIEISNYHAEAVQVEVLARIPVSKDANVKVEIPKGATPADETDVDGKSGIILWRLEAQPQQIYKINHYVDITYPKDHELNFEERINDD
jgi:uncharacterized protein (TIGR02231 family)